MPKLLVSLPEHGEVAHELTEALVTIGRVPDSVLQIQDISVSSHHAQLTLAGDGDYVLRDVGSTNGTQLNGRDVAPEEDHKLQNGDKLIFGKIEAHYTSENPAEAQPLPETEAAVAVMAETSKRPADFANASPFQTKKKKKDPAGLTIMILGALGIAAMVGVLVFIYFGGVQLPAL